MLGSRSIGRLDGSSSTANRFTARLPVGSKDRIENKELEAMQARSRASNASKDVSRGVDHKEVARNLKQEYVRGSKDPSIRALDSLNSLVKFLMKNDPDLDEMLKVATRLMFTQFNIKEVSIALKTPSDGLFRYVTMHGMRAEVWAAHMSLSYSLEQLIDDRKYKPTVISHHTRLYLAEDNPYADDETYTYSEHLMTISKRREPDDSIEGDYLDVFIYGPDDEILGWIETGSTWDSKIPDARTIRCLEILSSVLGIAISRHLAMAGAGAGSSKPAQGQS